LIDNRLHRFVHTAPDPHWISAGGNVLDAQMGYDLCEYRCCGGAVARTVRCLRGDLLDQLGAHVFELILELNLFCHGHPVLCHCGRAPALFNHHIAAARSERYLDRVCQNIHTLEKFLAGRNIECNHLCCHMDRSFRFLKFVY